LLKFSSNVNECKPLELGVESEKSDMSFALSTDHVEWGSLGLTGGGLHSSTSQLNLSRF
jgi:predicted NAD/FAD-binding protein